MYIYIYVFIDTIHICIHDGYTYIYHSKIAHCLLKRLRSDIVLVTNRDSTRVQGKHVTKLGFFMSCLLCCFDKSINCKSQWIYFCVSTSVRLNFGSIVFEEEEISAARLFSHRTNLVSAVHNEKRWANMYWLQCVCIYNILVSGGQTYELPIDCLLPGY